MPLDPQDAEGLEDEAVHEWGAAEIALIGAMAAAAARAADAGGDVRVAAAREWSRALGSRSQATAADLAAATPAMVERATEQAANRGAASAARESGTARQAQGGGRGSTDPITLPTARPQAPGVSAATATNRALDTAARSIPRNTRTAWDRIISDAVNRTIPGELTIQQAMQQAMDQAAREGIGFYRDSSGRKWGLDTYSEMAIRTGTNQALRDGHMAELLAQGIDLVIVSSHANPAPQCAPYEQKVLSLTGEHPNGRQTIDGQSVTVTASVAEAVANGLEHPNCRHVYTAYLPGFTEPLPVADDPDHEGYKATQQQRYYEREIRRSQRMEAAATTPEARAKAAARHRAYEAKLAAHRRQWDLPRRRHREKLRQPGNPMPQV